MLKDWGRMKKWFAEICICGVLAGCSREPLHSEMAKDVRRYAQSVDQVAFREKVLQSEQVAIVDFYATWCGPCRQIAPTMEQLAKEYEGRLKIYKVDIDKHRELADQYQIQSIPAFFAFKSGKLLERKTGAMSKSSFQAWFDTLIASAE